MNEAVPETHISPSDVQNFPYFIAIDLHRNNAVVCVKSTVRRGSAFECKIIYTKKINIIAAEGIANFFQFYCIILRKHRTLRSRRINLQLVLDG